MTAAANIAKIATSLPSRAKTRRAGVVLPLGRSMTRPPSAFGRRPKRWCYPLRLESEWCISLKTDRLTPPKLTLRRPRIDRLILAKCGPSSIFNSNYGTGKFLISNKAGAVQSAFAISRRSSQSHPRSYTSFASPSLSCQTMVKTP